MALTPKLSNVAANAEVDALTALLNGGYLEIYAGTQPTDADTAISGQTNLATLTFGTPAFGAGVAGVATANAIGADTDANATATATWYRLFQSGHTPGSGDEALKRVADGSIGTSSANLNLNSTAIQIHATVAVDSFTLTASKT